MSELLKSHIVGLAEAVGQLRECLSQQLGIDALERALGKVAARMTEIEARWGEVTNG